MEGPRPDYKTLMATLATTYTRIVPLSPSERMYALRVLSFHLSGMNGLRKQEDRRLRNATTPARTCRPTH